MNNLYRYVTGLVIGVCLSYIIHEGEFWYYALFLIVLQLIMVFFLESNKKK